MVTLSGSLLASRAFTTLLCKAMSSSVSTITSSNFSSNSFFRNWMSLSRWSEQQNKNILIYLCRICNIILGAKQSDFSTVLPSCLLSSFCMHLQCLSVSEISLKHSALKSSEWFRKPSIFTRLGPPACWGLRSGTDIVLHWWSVTYSTGR